MNLSKKLLQRNVDSLTRYYIHLQIAEQDEENIDFDILKINANVEKLLQYNRENIEGNKVSFFFPNLHSNDKMIFNELAKVANNQTYLSVQRYVHLFQGWFQIDGYSSQVNQIHVYFYSIDEQMKHLEESTSMLNAIQGIIFEIAEDLTYTQVICQDPALLFYSEKELLGRKISDFFPREITNEFNQAFHIAKTKRQDAIVIYSSIFPEDNRIFKATIHYLKETKKYIVNVLEITNEKVLEEEYEESKKMIDTFFALSNDLFCVIDNKGKILIVNQEWERKFGIPQQKLLEYSIKDMVADLNYQEIRSAYYANKDNENQFSFSNMMSDQSGNKYYIEWRCIIKEDMIYASGRDITEKKKMEKELELEKEILKTTLEFIKEGVISFDSNGIITYINNQAEGITEWNRKEAIGNRIENIFRITDCNKVKVNKAFFLETFLKLKEERTDQIVIITKDHHEVLLESTTTPITLENGKTNGIIMVFKNKVDRDEEFEQITHLSYYDQLTNVYNRRYYEEELKRTNDKTYLPLTLSIIDVNGLKLINDAFGHEAGDITLKKVVSVMKRYVRASDVIARIGGDEFVIIFPKTSSYQANLILQKIYREIPNETVESVHLSVSYGHHTKTKVNEQIEDVFKIAEDNMYSLKLSQSASMRTKTVNVIMKTLFEKSEREEQHSKRVSEFCVKIGTKLGLSSQEVGELQIAGIMHDIGKIVIDSAVLNKPGKLTDSEWLEIKRHPDVGYRILNSIPEFAHLADIVLCHHERWDGTGYPRKIAGESIPLLARIIAVADAYDAMTVGRPYRAALSFEEAKEELKKHRGTQFDPRIVDVFIEILDASSDLKTIDIITFRSLSEKLLTLSIEKTPLFPKKDHLPTTASQFLKDHGFSGYTMEFGDQKILYFGYRSYIPLREMEEGEIILPWQVVQPHTQGNRPMINVGLYIEGTISTSDPRGTGAMYHNINASNVTIFSRHLYGYQGYRWGYERYGVIQVDSKGKIIENFDGALLESGTNITLNPGDFLLTLFEADRNALGTADDSFNQSKEFAVGKTLKIKRTDQFIYFG
jgi:diguanylate cyclase (GGDEF)-like protein/PAS domain S-box-containing protein